MAAPGFTLAPRASGADAEFEALAAAVLDDVLSRSPVLASRLGDHRFDNRLDDLRPEAVDDTRRVLGARLTQVLDVDVDLLSPANRVDAQILRARLAERLFELDEVREHRWNPLVANPGTATWVLLARDFAPLGDRLRSVAARLAAVPEALATARATLRAMPRVHVETALRQFAGTETLLRVVLERALDAAPALRAQVEPARAVALEALAEHGRWLQAALPGADGDPRLGAERFAARLAHRIDGAGEADTLLSRAERDLLRIEEEIADVAAGLSGRRTDVRRLLDHMASDHPDATTVVPMSRDLLMEATAFVAEQRLVTVPDDAVEVTEMPEIHRGAAVAYCDPPGPLETAALPTHFAIAPPPDDWAPDRVASFFREYNTTMLRGLVVHEAMPGHAVQLGHARRLAAPTRVRAAFTSGAFVEGWAVYAEELMAARGFGGPTMRLQQLKMRLRGIINTILDIRVHAHGMTEPEAMRLMTGRGHQEEGEAAGKWRRALLTSAQLSTYHVGYGQVSGLVGEVRAAHPEWTDRQVHDAVLSQGSPPPHHLRSLLTGGAAGQQPA